MMRKRIDYKTVHVHKQTQPHIPTNTLTDMHHTYTYPNRHQHDLIDEYVFNTHTRTHFHFHTTHTHSYIFSNTHTHMHPCKHIPTSQHKHTHALHTLDHTHRYIYSHIYPHTRTHTLSTCSAVRCVIMKIKQHNFISSAPTHDYLITHHFMNFEPFNHHHSNTYTKFTRAANERH